MKQVLQAQDALAMVRDVPSPACPPGGLLVRNSFSVISSGTERSRVALAQKSLLGKARERPDLVREVLDRARREGARHTYDLVRRKLAQEAAVGYSSAGRVIAVGPEVRGDFKPGDAVACAGSGHANHADIVAVPINLCAKVPDGVPLEAAAFSTIAAIAMHGVRLAEVSLGERVAVIGCGLIGKIACRLLLCAGAEPIAIDTNPSRVQDAHRSGVKHALVADGSAAELALAATSGQGADAVVITAAASSSAPLHLAAEISRDRGRLVLVGAVPIDFPRPPLYDKELSFRVSRSYGPGRYDALYEERGFDYPIGYVRWTEQRNMESVLALVADGRLKLLDLIERVVPVENAAGAYEQIADRATRGAIVLAYGDAPDPAPSAVTLIGAVTGNGANGAPVAARPAPALARPPRIGLIGAGSFAVKTIVPALTAAGAQLELVGGGGGPSAEAAQRTLGFARVAASESDVIDDDAVDAVVVCTRHASHARLVMRALERGKHVFCEKPLALTAPEVEDVIAAARASGAVLAAGFNRRFSPQLRELRDLVTTGPQRLTACYRVSAGRLEKDHWVHDSAQGGGRILGECCHFIDALVFLAGSPVVQVFVSGYGESDLPLQARDNVVVTLRFASGSVGAIVYTSDGSPKLPKERVEVFCGSRTGILDDYRRLEILDSHSRRHSRTRAQDKGHVGELRAFVASVQDGGLPVDLAELRNVSLATTGAVHSLSTGLPVRIA